MGKRKNIAHFWGSVNKLYQAITIKANTVYFTLSILSYSEYSYSHPPLTCLCMMRQNIQSKWPYKGNTARKSKERPSPNHSPTTRLHSLTSYLTYHRNGEWGFPYSPFSGLQEVWTHRQWVSFPTSSLRTIKSSSKSLAILWCLAISIVRV